VLPIPEELAVQRCRHRVAAGGHDVPEDKIRQRYQRLWALVATAITRCDSATVYDNSTRKGPSILAHMSSGHLIGAPTWPAWTPRVLALRWPT
jgi:predicted ABC-type ATPase